jgi:uncharacterized protein YkwD
MPIKRYLLLAFATFFVVLVCASIAAAAPLRSSEARLLEAVNQARATSGLQPLRFDAKLTRAARAHSMDMIKHQYFAHGPFARRLQNFGARLRFSGENLAWGKGSQATAAAIVREWLASPEHRANLLRPGFTRIGIGAFRARFNGYSGVAVVTADFGGV